VLLFTISTMQAKGPAAALYFVLWVVIGNFILLTLFLAILINNFSDEPHQSQVGDHSSWAAHDVSKTCRLQVPSELVDAVALLDLCMHARCTHHSTQTAS
jgi:hypothetical protein